jgi:type IV pilus assembly protein PilV
MSLIEVMVSIVIVSIALVGLLGLLASTMQTSNGAQDRNRAAMIVNELVSAMWINGSTDYTTGAVQADLNALQAAVTNPNQPNFYLAPNAQLTVQRAGTQATITLQWTSTNQVANKAANTNNTYDKQVVSNIYTTQVVAP